MDRVIAVRNTKTVYRDGDKCIKVFNKDYSKADVLNEALNQARAEETGLNVPEILEITTVDDKWAVVSEYIKGRTLDELMRSEPENKEKYIEMLVRLQLGIFPENCSMLPELRDNMKRKISEAELDAAVRNDLLKRLEDMPEHKKLCHGDFNPSNIIVTEDGKPYIIDWSQAALGNASADAAGTYLFFSFNGDTEAAEQYLDLFCTLSGTEKQYVRKWIPLTAASLSVGKSEKERKFLISCANNSEYI